MFGQQGAAGCSKNIRHFVRERGAYLLLHANHRKTNTIKAVIITILISVVVGACECAATTKTAANIWRYSFAICNSLQA